ncbi:MAG: tRNA 2-thiouridine(34) synthase MnmA, partial [Acidimicrobiaceae bacterium]|nr:tRNA 2-thiouridine(34) synthase MnmA [Acidimicrobiaceae bacterium]
RGVDAAKDQSYVLHMLDAPVLDRLMLPVGEMTKDEVRRQAETRGLVTASKPDSQDVCFITASAGRRKFLGERIPVRSGRVVDTAGRQVGTIESFELVTVGQRRGLGAIGDGSPRYVLDVDADSATVTVGDRAALDAPVTPLEDWRWASGPVEGPVMVQTSAHGTPAAATIDADGTTARWAEPRRAVAPGQSVVAYAGDLVIGGGTAARSNGR